MHVYVIQEGTGHIKIGHSRNPLRRLNDLQLATPNRLFIRHTVMATNGPRIERGAHEILAAKAIGKEWFDATPDEGLDAIKQAKRFATRGQSIEKRRSMNRSQYRDALRALSLNQAQAAEFLGLSHRTSQDYALGKLHVPEPVAMLLRLMVMFRLTPADLPKA